MKSFWRERGLVPCSVFKSVQSVGTMEKRRLWAGGFSLPSEDLELFSTHRALGHGLSQWSTGGFGGVIAFALPHLCPNFSPSGLFLYWAPTLDLGSLGGPWVEKVVVRVKKSGANFMCSFSQVRSPLPVTVHSPESSSVYGTLSDCSLAETKTQTTLWTLASSPPPTRPPPLHPRLPPPASLSFSLLHLPYSLTYLPSILQFLLLPKRRIKSDGDPIRCPSSRHFDFFLLSFHKVDSSNFRTAQVRSRGENFNPALFPHQQLRLFIPQTHSQVITAIPPRWSSKSYHYLSTSFLVIFITVVITMASFPSTITPLCPSSSHDDTQKSFLSHTPPALGFKRW